VAAKPGQTPGVAGVEFVDEPVGPTSAAAAGAAPGEPADELPGRRSRFGTRARHIAAVVLFLGAGALAAAAAFQNVYVLGFGHGSGSYRLGVDAWGDYSGGNGARTHEHEARYAWPLLAGAAVFVLLAVQAVVRTRSSTARRTATAGRFAGVAASGLMAGVAVAIYLYASAFLDSQRARTGADLASGDPIRGDIVTRIGSCPALALAAAVCGALAVGVSVGSAAHRAGRAAAPPQDRAPSAGRLAS
jgi:hypothetical protein